MIFGCSELFGNDCGNIRKVDMVTVVGPALWILMGKV